MKESNTEKKANPPPAMRIFTWKRFFLLSGFLILTVAIFHLQILHLVAPPILRCLALKYHFQLEFELEGPSWSRVSLIHLKARETVPQSGLRSAAASRIQLDYNLSHLLFSKSGPPLIEQILLENPTIELDPRENQPSSQTSQAAQDPAAFLHQPVPVFFKRIEIRHATIRQAVNGPGFSVQDANLVLAPDTSGSLTIAVIDLPGTGRFENLQAQTTFSPDHLMIENLKLPPDLTLRKFEFHFAGLDGKPGSIQAALSGFGGELNAKIAPEPDSSIHPPGKLRAQINVSHLSIPPLGHLAAISTPSDLVLSSGSFSFLGEPAHPASWQTALRLQFSSFHTGTLLWNQPEIRAETRDGSFNGFLSAATGNNRLQFHTAIPLPDSVSNTDSLHGTGSFRFDLPDPSGLTTVLTSGSAVLEGKFKFSPATYHIESKLTALNLRSEKGYGKDALLRCTADGEWPHHGKQVPTPKVDFELAANEMEFDVLHLDTLQLQLRSENDSAIRVSGTIGSGKNRADFECMTRIPDLEEPIQLSKLPFNAIFHAAFTDSKAFIVHQSIPAFTAERLNLSGSASSNGNLSQCNGFIQLSGINLVSGTFCLEHLTVNALIRDGIMNANTFQIRLANQLGYASGSGSCQLSSPYAYTGAVSVSIKDLTTWRPVFAAVGADKAVSGKVHLDWNGTGTTTSHSGTIHMKIEDASFDTVQSIHANLNGHYSPEQIEFPEVEIGAAGAGIQTSIQMKPEGILFSPVNASWKNRQLLSGSFLVPLDFKPRNNGPYFLPDHGVLSGDLKLAPTPVDFLIPSKQPSSLSGTIHASLAAKGTILNPEIDLQIEADALRTKETGPKWSPVSARIQLSLRKDQLSLTGTAQQADVKPLSLSGTMPVRLVEVIRKGLPSTETPIRASIKLPPSPLKNLQPLLPGVRYLDGTMGLDVFLAGPLAHPEITGTARMDIPGIRFRNASWPALNQIKGLISFTGNRAVLNQLECAIAGGKASVAGSVSYTNPAAPVLDLKLNSENALLMRNDTLTLRANSALIIRGPLNQAIVSGHIGLTKCRFYREIELFPIEFQSNPFASIPTTQTIISLPTPPFRDWKFDVVIVTADPFRISGNLTNGEAAANLHLLGTGLTPTLEGLIRLDHLVATLPFSTMNVDRGFIYFRKRDPFLPILDIQAGSTLRDHNITAYLYGQCMNPTLTLSSSPPLPQEDILSLLATGVTRDDLTGNNDIAAGRAVSLAAKQLYAKIFKSPKAESKESFASRFDVDIRGVDPKTGHQDMSASFKISNQLYLIGNVTVTGDVSGRVRYLIRLR